MESAVHRYTILVIIAYAVLSPVAAAQDSAAADTATGIYTTEQARRGEKLFRQHCAACHSATEFRGAFFMNVWGKGTVYPLFDLLRTQMPIDNPGKLTSEEYVAVIAHMLRLNGLPTGPAELPADPEQLRTISITPSTSSEP